MDDRRTPPKEAPDLLLKAADAAVSWWRQHRPVGWSVAKHLENPAVNCTTVTERRLAVAAARWHAIQHPSAGAPKDA